VPQCLWEHPDVVEGLISDFAFEEAAADGINVCNVQDCIGCWMCASAPLRACSRLISLNGSRKKSSRQLQTQKSIVTFFLKKERVLVTI
jgi:Fe-S-cluster-containing hydrogenase component 2